MIAALRTRTRQAQEGSVAGGIRGGLFENQGYSLNAPA